MGSDGRLNINTVHSYVCLVLHYSPIGIIVTSKICFYFISCRRLFQKM